MDESLRKLGVTTQQYLIMSVISSGCSSNPKAIARKLDTDPGAITRIVDRLIKKGFLKRQACPKDRRVCYVLLTPKGNALVPKLESAALEAQKKYLSRLSDGDIQGLHELLRNLAPVEPQ